jgi:hypothetical protein
MTRATSLAAPHEQIGRLAGRQDSGAWRCNLCDVNRESHAAMLYHLRAEHSAVDALVAEQVAERGQPV